MNKNTFTSKIAGIAVEIPNELKDFTLTTKESSQVSFYGVDMAKGTIYVQFKTGKGYLYPGQTIDAMKACMQAESIGSWVIHNLARPKDKAPAEFEKVEYAIKPVDEPVKA